MAGESVLQPAKATPFVSGFCEPCTKFSPNALFSPVVQGAQALFHDAFLRLDHYELSIKALAGLHMLWRPLTVISMSIQMWLRFLQEQTHSVRREL